MEAPGVTELGLVTPGAWGARRLFSVQVQLAFQRPEVEW